MRLINILEPWLPVLGETFLAIYRPALGGLERYFTLYFAVGANGLVHLSRTEASPVTKSTITHINYSCRLYSANINRNGHSINSYVLL
jgi:hypothetical protein